MIVLSEKNSSDSSTIPVLSLHSDKSSSEYVYNFEIPWEKCAPKLLKTLEAKKVSELYLRKQ